MERKEQTVITLEEQGADGQRYIARLEGGIADIQVQTVETYASLRIGVSDLESFWSLVGRVLQDESIQPEETEEVPS